MFRIPHVRFENCNARHSIQELRKFDSHLRLNALFSILGCSWVGRVGRKKAYTIVLQQN